MRHLNLVRSSLESKLPVPLVGNIMETFSGSVSKFNAGDHEGCLVKAGHFSEHVLRALIFESTGSTPNEIKNFAEAVRSIAKSENMSETLMLLVPRILASAVYDLRSKRGAVHVKGVNPQKRDSALAVLSMSWVLSELMSAYGQLGAQELDSTISTLMRRTLPIVEHAGGQPIVTQSLPAYLETLALIDGHPEGISRRDLGKLVKCSSSAVTHALTKISSERLAHLVSGAWFITGKGERVLDDLVFNATA